MAWQPTISSHFIYMHAATDSTRAYNSAYHMYLTMGRLDIDR